MSISGFPTSSDIYIEANGRRIAVVQSYRTVASRREKLIEAFGESEPVAALCTGTAYRVELSRLYATDEALSDGVSFYALDDFSLVIVKPDRRVVYGGCRWCEIEEEGKLSDTVAERLTLIAASRTELEP